MSDLSRYSRLIFILDIIPETMKIFARLVLSARVDRTNGVKKTDYNLRVKQKRTRSETRRQKFIRLLHATVLLYRSIRVQSALFESCAIFYFVKRRFFVLVIPPRQRNYHAQNIDLLD